MRFTQVQSNKRKNKVKMTIYVNTAKINWTKIL